MDELVVVAVRAAVVTPERHLLRRFFSWSWRLSPELVEGLVVDGRVERAEPGWLAAT